MKRRKKAYVGTARGVAGVFSQGETVEELKENIAEAYRVICETSQPAHAGARTIEARLHLCRRKARSTRREPRDGKGEPR